VPSTLCLFMPTRPSHHVWVTAVLLAATALAGQVLAAGVQTSKEDNALAGVHAMLIVLLLLLPQVLKTSETKQALLVQKEAAHSRHLHLGSSHHHHHHHQHRKGKANKGFNLHQASRPDKLQQQQQQEQEGAQDAEVEAASGQLEAAEHRGLPTSSPSGKGAAAAAAAAAAGDDALPSPPQQQHPGLTLPSSKRRRSSNTGGSSAGPVNAATAPPLRKEPVGREEAVGLLQAVMKQRKGP